MTRVANDKKKPGVVGLTLGDNLSSDLVVSDMIVRWVSNSSDV